MKTKQNKLHFTGILYFFYYFTYCQESITRNGLLVSSKSVILGYWTKTNADREKVEELASISEMIMMMMMLTDGLSHRERRISSL